MEWNETALRMLVHEEIAKAKRFTELSRDVLASNTFEELETIRQERKAARSFGVMHSVGYFMFYAMIFAFLACVCEGIERYVVPRRYRWVVAPVTAICTGIATAACVVVGVLCMIPVK